MKNLKLVTKKNILFKYEGKTHKFSFTPDEPDEWFSFKSGKLEFDVHYNENYSTINVYEVIDGLANYDKSIYTKKIINQKSNQIF